MNLKEIVKIALAAGLIAIGIHEFAQAADGVSPPPPVTQAVQAH